MSQPLVSIVVPVFNGAPYLREALDSILAQTYPRCEVIVMDDASTDETPAIIASYGDRVRHIRQQANRGIYENVNDGIAAARGELIATYHSDDVYEPTIVERQVEYLERHPDVGAVFTLSAFIDAQAREYGRMRLPTEIAGAGPLDYRATLNGLLSNKNRFLVCPSAMVRASVHADVGVYRQDRFRNTSDLEMWLRIGQRYPIGIVEEHLIRYRHFHGSSAQRYHRLRTAPENYFGIMDLYLEDGGRSLATARALTDFEAHRTEDRLMAGISHYIMNDRPGLREALRAARMRPVLVSRKVQRLRLGGIYALLQALSRLPHVPAIADAFQRRWHSKRSPFDR